MGKGRRREHSRFEILTMDFLFQNKQRVGLEPITLALQWWLNVSMEAFNIPFELSQIVAFNHPFNLPFKLPQICSQTISKPTQNPSKEK